MRAYIDVLDTNKMKMDRVPVSITAVHPDGTYDYSGDIYTGSQVSIPLYDEIGKRIMPTVEAKADPVGELMQKIAVLEEDMQEVKKTKQALQ